MAAPVDGESEEQSGGEARGRGARDPAACWAEHALHRRDVGRHTLVRERDDLGRMIVAFDAPHNAIALIVQPVGGECRVRLLQGRALHQLKRSDELFAKASGRIDKTIYVYDKWWQALYWRGEYKEAWEKITLMRTVGGRPHEAYLRELRAKMPEPRR